MTAAELVIWASGQGSWLAVATPLLGAALSLLAPSRTLAWLIASACAALSVAAAAVGSYHALFLADPSAPAGAAADGVAAFAAPVVSGAALLVTLAFGQAARELEPRAAPFAYALLLAMSAGWLGALYARSLAEFVLAAVGASLAGVALAAISGGRDRGALNGALRLFGASGLGAALLLLGAGLVQRGAGVADLQSLPMSQAPGQDMALVGFALAIIGIGLVAGLAPLHVWLGAVFGRGGDVAPLAIGAVGMTGAAAALVRVAAYALQSPALGGGVAALFAGLGAASIVICSLQAVGATSLRRLVAYCAVTQMGGVLVAAALGSVAGFAAAFLQLAALAATTPAMLCAAAVAPGEQPRSMEAIDGLGKRAPLAGLALTLSALSAMGAPLTLGFLGRWRLMEAGLGAEWWWTAPAAVAASLAGVFYGGRLIERMYFRRAAIAAPGRPDLWRLALAPGLVSSIAIVALAVAPHPLIASAQAAAEAMIGGAP